MRPGKDRPKRRPTSGDDAREPSADGIGVKARARPPLRLFWCTTEDHDEDWFIVAKTAAGARRLHEDEEGYGRGDSDAGYVCDVPASVKDAEPAWPSDALHLTCGAEFVAARKGERAGGPPHGPRRRGGERGRERGSNAGPIDASMSDGRARSDPEKGCEPHPSLGLAIGFVLALAACSRDRSQQSDAGKAAPRAAASVAEGFFAARAAHPTVLVRRGPAPQPPDGRHPVLPVRTQHRRASGGRRRDKRRYCKGVCFASAPGVLCGRAGRASPAASVTSPTPIPREAADVSTIVAEASTARATQRPAPHAAALTAPRRWQDPDRGGDARSGVEREGRSDWTRSPSGPMTAHAP